MVAKLKFTGIDGRAPPGVEPVGAAVSVLGAAVRPGEALWCLPVVKDPIGCPRLGRPGKKAVAKSGGA